LKKRGQLSLYFPKGDLKELLINPVSYQEGLSGRQAYYYEEQLMFVFK
jgi:nitrogen fixation protein